MCNLELNKYDISPITDKYLCFYYSPNTETLEYPESDNLQIDPTPIILKEGFFVALEEYRKDDLFINYKGIHFKRYTNYSNIAKIGFLIPNTEIYHKLSIEAIPQSIKDYLNSFGILDYYKQ